MRRLGFVLACVLGLCAFDVAPPLDMSALPAATTAMEHQEDQCKAQMGDFKTESDFDNCSLAAARAFADTAKVRDQAPYRALVKGTRRIAADLAADRTGMGLAGSDSQKLWWKFFDRLAGEENAYMARHNPAGKIPAFDTAAAQQARTAEANAIRACQASTKGYESSRYDCLLTAARDFAAAVKMRDMYRFTMFEALVRIDSRALARDRERPGEMEDRYQSLHDALFARMGAKYSSEP